MCYSITVFDIALIAISSRINPYTDRITHDGKSISVFFTTSHDVSEFWHWYCESMQHNPTSIRFFYRDGDEDIEFCYSDFLTPTDHPDHSERMSYET